MALWPTLFHPIEKIELLKMLRCFTPIYRISWPALNYIDEMCIKGWVGHQEVLVPTLLYHSGFRLRDFGGMGEFVPQTEKNRFYLDSSTECLEDGTMRCRPIEMPLFNKPRNKLIHPVNPTKFRKKLRYLASLTLKYLKSKVKKIILIIRYER